MAQLDDGTATASPHQGSGSGAGGLNDVELTFADVEKIGQDTAALSGKAAEAKARLGDARGHSAAFGSYPPARALYAHHQAVVNVFEDTLAAITTDLDDFGNTIVQAVHAYEQTDDDVGASLASVATKLDPRGVTDKYLNSRNLQGHELEDVEIDEPELLGQEFPGLDEDALQVLKDTKYDGTDDAGDRGGYQESRGR